MEQVKTPIVHFSTSKKYVYSIGILSYQLLITSLGFYLSSSTSWLIWLVGQSILALSFLQWFFLIHDLAHNMFLPSKVASVIFGHIASYFSLIPFYPWKYVHNAHHRWTGWREKDPTVPKETIDDLPSFQKKLIDFCWKYWIPIIAASFVLTTFYNVSKLKLYFDTPNKMRRIRLSIAIQIVLYLMTFIFLGSAYFTYFGLAQLIFLSIADPYLLSQHTHLDYKDIEKEILRPVRFIEQDLFSRTIRFPRFIEKYVLYYTNYHGLHHQYPWLSIYELNELEVDSRNQIPWFQWLRLAKSLPGHILIYQSFKHTGVKL